jgi:hypothetical protein
LVRQANSQVVKNGRTSFLVPTQQHIKLIYP